MTLMLICSRSFTEKKNINVRRINVGSFFFYYSWSHFYIFKSSISSIKQNFETGSVSGLIQ